MATKKAKTTDQKAFDMFQNMIARLGFGTPHAMEGAQYPLTRLTRDYGLMNSLYRSSWIVRKVIDTVPQDALKQWIELTCQVTPEQLDTMTKSVRKTKVRAAVIQAMKWGRLYGGAGAVMIIEGQENQLSEPVNYDMIMPGSFKGLLVFDRWSGITPNADTIDDINNPDFGLPASYRVTTNDGKAFNVHSSRVLRFIGRDLPNWEKTAEMQWGVSEVEIIYEELKKRDNTSWNIASLIFLANIRIIKMKGYGELLASGNQRNLERIYNTIAAENHLMTNQGVQVMDQQDDFDTRQYSFTGVNEIYQSFMLDLAGATGIPMTRLFGRSPAGMNATGESDENNYESLISEKQDSEIRPQLDKLIPVMCLSEWGYIPDDLDYTFSPFKTLDGKERADLAKAKTDSLVGVKNAGGISQKIFMKELRQIEDETGMFSNITDEDIERADDTLDDKTELLGGMGKYNFNPKSEGLNEQI